MLNVKVFLLEVFDCYNEFFLVLFYSCILVKSFIVKNEMLYYCIEVFESRRLLMFKVFMFNVLMYKYYEEN